MSSHKPPTMKKKTNTQIEQVLNVAARLSVCDGEFFCWFNHTVCIPFPVISFSEVLTQELF